MLASADEGGTLAVKDLRMMGGQGDRRAKVLWKVDGAAKVWFVIMMMMMILWLGWSSCIDTAY